MKQYDFALEAILRLLRKAIPSQLALSSFELLNLKAPIFEERRSSNGEVGLRNGLIIGVWVIDRAIWDGEESYIALG